MPDPINTDGLKSPSDTDCLGNPAKFVLLISEETRRFQKFFFHPYFNVRGSCTYRYTNKKSKRLTIYKRNKVGNINVIVLRLGNKYHNIVTYYINKQK